MYNCVNGRSAEQMHSNIQSLHQQFEQKDMEARNKLAKDNEFLNVEYVTVKKALEEERKNHMNVLLSFTNNIVLFFVRLLCV
jgi:hypothetical protein